mgnify:FL=1|jgi:hypothetical protein
MIGMFCVATFPYYDTSTGRNKFKKRPMIILGQADSSDYVTLPVSKVSIKENIDDEYDLEIVCDEYPLLNLNCTSYIRTHKQTITNRNGIRTIISVKDTYPELWLSILQKIENFQKKIIDHGLE